MEKTIARKNLKLLELAENVFGNGIVVDAFVTTWAFADCTHEEISHRLDYEDERVFKNNDGGGLDLSCLDIILEFCNGRKIIFSNSEWGSANIISNFEIERQ